MSAAQSITRHFNGDWHGNQGAFPTPGHSKSDRGMTVKDGDGGDVVFHSHNGGDWREVKDECRRLGFIPERPSADDSAGGGWRETGRYEYVGDDGAVAYRTVRKEKAGERKRFVAQRPDGRGGWANKLGDATRIPYRLPDLLAADLDAPVLFVEGERKADLLAGMGFVATAIAFGAKGWRDDYARHFEGRTIIILPDNDAPGAEFAAKVKASLDPIATRVAIVQLPDLRPGDDIVDWVPRQDHGADAGPRLRELIEAALRAPSETFPIADLGAWAATTPTPKTFVMAGFVPEREVTLFTGPGGVNKSTFGLQLCACSAAGVPMLGVPVAAGPALYVTAEDEDRENHWRLAKIASAIGTTLDRLVGRLAVVSLRGRLSNELATFDAEGRLRTAAAFQMLRATIVATRSKLLVLDNVGHLYVGNENDRGQVTAFVNLLYLLCRELGVTIVLIGHPNKAGDSYSGSTAWLNAVRSQIVLERPADGYDPDARTLSLGKANYARPDQQIAFRWHDFALMRDCDLPDDRRRELAAAIAISTDNVAFLECLKARAAQGEGRHVGPTPGPNYAPTQFEGMREAKGLKRDRLKAAMDRLYAIEAIETHTFRNTTKGRDVTIIRVADGTPNPHPEPLPNTVPEPPRTVFPNTPPHTPYTTYMGAAPLGSAAPPSQWKETQALGSTRVVFPPDDYGDDLGDIDWGNGA